MTSADVFLIEPIDDGERGWTSLTAPYITLSDDRDRIAAAIQDMTWYPVPTFLPFTAGLLLQGLLQHFDMRTVAQVGISAEPLPFPDKTHIDRYPHDIDPAWLHPDHLATCTVVGIQQWRPTGWLQTYFLDTGTEARGLAVDEVKATHPGGVTTACVIHRHNDCPGTVRSQTKPPASCQCHWGCSSRP